jgi:hypothetical protein
MKILFYSNKCEFSKKILTYINKNEIQDLFKMVDIDTNVIPKDIKIVPTIIDVNLNQIMEGKNAFEYLTNIKYFNIKTNNIELHNKIPDNPKINEDTLAQSNSIGLELNDMEIQKKSKELLPTEVKTPIQPVIKNTNKGLLMRMRR